MKEINMVKKMRKMTGRLVDLVTSKRFLTMVGLALVSNALAYASTSTTGLPWETPLQTVQQSLTGPVAAGISVVGIAAGGMALVFGGELSEFAKRSCYAVIATAVIVGAGTIMSTLFSSSSAVIAMTGGF
jgi:type IV secretion system protein VirB2